MMMPANFSAIAADEMSYVNGGFVDVMDFKLFEKNLFGTLGVHGLGNLLSSTLGTVFTGDYVFGEVCTAINDAFVAGNLFNSALLLTTAYAGVWYLGTFGPARWNLPEEAEWYWKNNTNQKIPF